LFVVCPPSSGFEKGTSTVAPRVRVFPFSFFSFVFFFPGLAGATLPTMLCLPYCFLPEIFERAGHLWFSFLLFRPRPLFFSENRRPFLDSPTLPPPLKARRDMSCEEALCSFFCPELFSSEVDADLRPACLLPYASFSIEDRGFFLSPELTFLFSLVGKISLLLARVFP